MMPDLLNASVGRLTIWDLVLNSNIFSPPAVSVREPMSEIAGHWHPIVSGQNPRKPQDNRNFTIFESFWMIQININTFKELRQ